MVLDERQKVVEWLAVPRVRERAVFIIAWNGRFVRQRFATKSNIREETLHAFRAYALCVLSLSVFLSFLPLFSFFFRRCDGRVQRHGAIRNHEHVFHISSFFCEELFLLVSCNWKSYKFVGHLLKIILWNDKIAGCFLLH